jgi:hypothetical protein
VILRIDELQKEQLGETKHLRVQALAGYAVIAFLPLASRGRPGVTPAMYQAGWNSIEKLAVLLSRAIVGLLAVKARKMHFAGAANIRLTLLFPVGGTPESALFFGAGESFRYAFAR